MRAWFVVTSALNGIATVHVHLIFLDIPFMNHEQSTGWNTGRLQLLLSVSQFVAKSHAKCFAVIASTTATLAQRLDVCRSHLSKHQIIQPALAKPVGATRALTGTPC